MNFSSFLMPSNCKGSNNVDSGIQKLNTIVTEIQFACKT